MVISSKTAQKKKPRMRERDLGSVSAWRWQLEHDVVLWWCRKIMCAIIREQGQNHDFRGREENLVKELEGDDQRERRK